MNLGDLGNIIALQAVCQAHSASWVTSTHTSHAQVTISSITIKFFSWRSLDGWVPTPEPPELPEWIRHWGSPIYPVFIPYPAGPLHTDLPSVSYLPETEAWVKGGTMDYGLTSMGPGIVKEVF